MYGLCSPSQQSTLDYYIVSHYIYVNITFRINYILGVASRNKASSMFSTAKKTFKRKNNACKTLFEDHLITIHMLLIAHGSHNPSCGFLLPIITRTQFIILNEKI